MESSTRNSRRLRVAVKTSRTQSGRAGSARVDSRATGLSGLGCTAGGAGAGREMWTTIFGGRKEPVVTGGGVRVPPFVVNVTTCSPCGLARTKHVSWTMTLLF